MAKAKTKIELEQEKKKELAEDEHYLEQVDKHGPKIVEKYERERAKEVKEKEDAIKTDLETKKDRRFTYLKALAKHGQEGLGKIEFPDGWEYYALPTSDGRVRLFGKWFKSQFGVLLVLKSPDNKVFTKGIRISFNPTIDTGAVDKLVVQAENTLDSERGLLLSDEPGIRKTKSGIVIPK